MKDIEYQFEICANGVESCLAAQAGGADRVELCAAIPEGGTTPSYGEIRQARRLLTSTRLHVIIRPRGGDFVYSALEAERMISDIEVCRDLGVDGVVFGCLTLAGDVDTTLCERLLAASQGLSVTFHRAFDRCRCPREALEDIVRMGFHRLLTSGQKPTAEQGIPLLHDLQQQAAGRIVLLAGSGVNEDNIRRIHNATGIREFHFSARSPISHDAEFGDRLQTNAERVRRTMQALRYGSDTLKA
ncbi:MAG: copper homeostasis protein CutC [Bacteroidaceae bacterium]|nr:copper homeostasis protein CutC [Bacteroidaceae bacterium]